MEVRLVKPRLVDKANPYSYYYYHYHYYDYDYDYDYDYYYYYYYYYYDYYPLLPPLLTPPLPLLQLLPPLLWDLVGVV